jgi:hypothetical protein
VKEKKDEVREKDCQSRISICAGYSEEQKEEAREKNRQSRIIIHARYSEEQKEEARKKARLHNHAIRQKQCNMEAQVQVEKDVYIEDVNTYTVDICGDVETEASVLQCQQNMKKTVVTSHEAEFQEDAVVHKMLVCIVCDCCLIGNEPVFWISRETLKFHENVLLSTYFYKDVINPILKSQYSVSDELVGHLLLSP